MKCDNCLNARVILSENGRHRICCLSEKKAMDCILGKESNKVERPKKDGDVDENSN